MIAWLFALAVLAAALTWGLQRELDRLEREAAYRRWLATSPRLQELKAAFNAFSAAIGVALLPAMSQMATAAIDATEAMKRLNEVINSKPDGTEQP